LTQALCCSRFAARSVGGTWAVPKILA
jgi:hypothetical protein